MLVYHCCVSASSDVYVCVFVVSDLYKLSGDRQGEAEGYKMHDSFTQSLLKDHFQASQLPEHRLIQVCPLSPVYCS